MDSNKLCKIWYKQEITRKDGSILSIRFQDLPPSRREEAINFLITYMIKEESIQKASGIYKNQEAVAEYHNFIEKYFEKDAPHVTLCCVDNDSEIGGKFIGMSTIMQVDKNHSAKDLAEQVPVTTKEMKSFFNILVVLEEASDLENKFEKHYHGAGIIVHPEYRRLGIANEFIRIRSLICKKNNIPMTSAWMTSVGTQKAAEKNNYKVHTELKPSYIGQKCNVTFDNEEVNHKLMYVVID